METSLHLFFTIQKINGISKKKKNFIRELIEDCELNRFLEIGLEVKMIKMSNKSKSIDTKKDVIEINKLFKKKNAL